MAKSFVAKYAGACHNCDVKIEPGDNVHYDSGGEEVPLRGRGLRSGYLAHVECPDPADAPGQTTAYTKPTKFTGATLEEMGY